MSWWAERFKGPQRVLCLLLFIFLLLTLVHSSSPRQKSENDLVFEEDHEPIKNLIITGKSSNHWRGKNSSSEKVIDKSKRFRWNLLNDEPGDRKPSKKLSHSHSQHKPLSPNVPPSHKTSTSIRSLKEMSGGLSSSPYQLTNVGRKRAARVPETDDEDLINSGDEAGSGERLPGPYYAPHVPSIVTQGPGRGDTSLERRYYRVTLTIGKSWSPSLDTRSSKAFTVYYSELENEIRQVMGLEAEHIHVVKFVNINDPAFVRCVFDLGVVHTPREQVEEEFLTYLDVGSIGQLRIRRDGFSVRDVGAPQEACPEGHLECDSGKCVDFSLRCNFINDCGENDNTDERGCSIPVTQPTTTSAPVMATTSRPVLYFNQTNTISEERGGGGSFGGVHVVDQDRVPVPIPSSREGCRADDQVRCSGGSEIYICSDQFCDGENNCPSGEDEDPIKCSENSCPTGQFSCDLTKCIDDYRRCDGIRDCSDNTDEGPECRQPPRNGHWCESGEFTCKSGNPKCIPKIKQCDTFRNCEGGEDEHQDCPIPQCSEFEFQCSDGKCIQKHQQCNSFRDCSDGLDEANCRPPGCSPFQFQCRDGSCIDIIRQCNQFPDCPDGSDEGSACNYIPPAQCRPNEFRCRRGGCIPLSALCNSYQECDDGEDEEPSNCPPCRSSEFRCEDGRCIPEYLRCNGRSECSRGEDERDCRVRCKPDQFQCADGLTCVPQDFVCNNRGECPDRSDEIGCLPPEPACRENQFTCHAGGCVDLRARCDNSLDCQDGSDELNCTRATTHRPSTCRPGEYCRPSLAHGLNLRTYPAEQTIKQDIAGNEVVFQCRDEGALRAPVRWSRGNGLALPPGSRDFNGRLEMPNIAVDHTGTYICEAVGYPSSTPGSRVSVYLRVDSYEPPATRPPSACGVNQATCASGECISKSMVCNGKEDCDDGSDESRCRGREGCEPNEFQCDNKRCVPKQWVCDSDRDCGDDDNSDERNCAAPPPGSPCRFDEFRCSSGDRCIPKAYHCDREVDCPDRSDELGCTAPVIQRPPPPIVNIEIGYTFNITCTAVGTPTPEVVWRLNWGHIPDKCVTSSSNGVGVLTCTNIQIVDQGAYSCESINTLGSTFAIPDCILVVKPAPGLCSTGFFNELATSPRECIPCFCQGQASQCSSSNLYLSQLPSPDGNYRLLGVSINALGGTVEIQDKRYSIPTSSIRVLPIGVQVQISSVRTLAIPSDVIPYFALPTSHCGNLLRSYGGHLRYSLRYRGSGRKLTAPDVIISGNGLTLLHLGTEVWSPNREHAISVRFWVGEWYKRVAGRPGGDQPAEGVEPASREEILSVLSNAEFILVRAQYDQGSSLDTTISSIRLDTAVPVNTGQGQAAFVEECRCPQGYTGLSCEECAPGFERRQQGPWLGICVKTQPRLDCRPGEYMDFQQCLPCPCPSTDRRFGTSCYKDVDSGLTCSCLPGHTGRNCDSCAPGYEKSRDYPFQCQPASASCDVEGSLSPIADPSGRCICKQHATGPTCNECQPNTFFRSSINQHGCISCFCMGVTPACGSSNWYRTQETAVFLNNPLGFTLVDEAQGDEIKDGFIFESDSREIGFREFSRYPPGTYYWQLPYNFLGDKVTAYGGYLNYSIRYVPQPGGQSSPNNAADVEINGNDIRLLYFRKSTLSPNRQETITVPLVEQHWQRQDGQPANREHFLMALANLDGLLIKATYTTSTREAYLSNVVLDVAIPKNTGQDRAFAVEQCSCPVGYTGLSCQECAYGYTRSLRGLYLGLCEPCSCNGHSDECDPKTGVCRNCRGHTTGDFCGECEDGYSGDPRGGECYLETARCYCDPRGSARPDCPDGRNCLCKGNVEGASCNLCRPGTFSLQEVNSLGCLECFCSRASTECASANLYRSTIDLHVLSGPHGATLTDSTRTASIQEISVDSATGELVYRYPPGTRSERLFWSLPSKFTGNRLTSYGGKLRATRRYLVRPGTNSTPTEDIDVILVGSSGISLYWIYGSLLSGQEVGLEVSLRETAGWRHIGGAGNMASRSDILEVLKDLEAVLIRASFTDDMEATYIKEISLDDAVRQNTPFGIVMDVEECRCPPGYEGMSCEQCSPGFYLDVHDRSRTQGGSCKQCPCSDNSEGCRVENGRPVCLCRPGFSGAYCDARDRVLVELSPVKVHAQVGATEDFYCSYSSRLRFRIVFLTFPDWNWLKAEENLRSDGDSYLIHKFGNYRLPSTQWTLSLRGRIPIFPKLQRVICRIIDEKSETIAEVYSSITPGSRQQDILTVEMSGERPSSQVTPRLQVAIDEPAQLATVGTYVTFRCTARNTQSIPLRITWSKDRGAIPAGRARDDGQGLLVITQARKEDSGTYFCSVSDGLATIVETAILTVETGESEEGIRQVVPSPPQAQRPVVTLTPSSYEARPGETVRFRCDVSDRSAQIQWTKVSGVLPLSANQGQDGTLTLSSVRETDSGVYVCTAVATSGQSAQGQARLTVSFLSSPPSARIEPERQTVAQGSLIEIRCVPTGNPTPTIEWSKVGGQLPSSSSRTSEVLRIDRADINDRGVYVCQVENSAGKSLASAIVEVERREAPQIEMYPNRAQTVIRDGSALFQCRVTAGIPSPTLSWSRANGQRLPSTAEEIQGGVLRFNRVTGDEFGQYVCTAENLAGKITAIATLAIQTPPKISITPSSPHRIRSGDSVRLECRAEGDPLPTLTWKKLQPGQLDGVELASSPYGSPQTAFYEINRVSKADEGSYSCVAKNEAGVEEGRIQLLVDDFDESPPTHASPGGPPPREREEVYYFPIGSRAELRCIPALEGAMTDQLYLDWNRVDSGRMPQEYDVRDGILFISDVRSEDAGLYSCSGTNVRGDIVFTVIARLEVVGSAPPRIELQPATQTVRRGDNVNINCIASGDQPITINWFKADRRPLPNSVIVNGPQLMFRGIEVSDAGRYVCSATNAGGTSDSVAEVRVNTSPAPGPAIFPGRPPMRRELSGVAGHTLEMRCNVRATQAVVWTKDGGPPPRTALVFGPILTILNLQREDAGMYVCETHDTSETIELTVEDVASVSVRIVPNKDLVRVGENLDLRCDVNGDPDPIIRWTKVIGDFEDNVILYDSVLKITDVRHENGGVYKCIVNTPRGVYEKDFPVVIQANPNGIQNSPPVETRSVPYGITVTMDCKTELHNPVEYTWTRQGGVLPGTAQVSGATLTIPEATAEEAGVYVCFATNPVTSVDVTTVLVVTGAVPYFTQAPNSYMSLPTLPDSYLKFDIEISFKPENNNGLVLYNGQKKDGSGDFISFGISNGYPEFRFDVGSGPAVIRGTRPLELGQWHTVNLSRSKSEGMMIIDESEHFTGSIYGSFQGLDLLEPLYVGGHPNFKQVHRLAGQSKGFVGCISELIIGSKKQQLLRDSQSSRGVAACDTCAQNSCTNGAACQEGLSKRGFKCICPPGYSGEDCQVVGQSCYPGACGIGKCVNVQGGFNCYCPFGKSGLRCDRDVTIYEPAFSGDSYLSYSTPKAIKRLKMALKVKPETDEDGLLMYCSQTEDGLGDYTSLAIKDRHLEFQYDTGSGPAVIKSRHEIKVGEWMDITAQRQLQDGELIIAGTDVVKGKSPGSNRGLNLKTPFYIGGFDQHRLQLNSNVGVSRGFLGCISELDIAGEELDITKSVVEGANVDNCRNNSQACLSNPCQNGGTCGDSNSDHMCACTSGFTGRFCETEDLCSSRPCKNGGTCYSLKGNYRCSCFKGFHGKKCEEAMDFSESVAFRGEGYLEMSSSFLSHSSTVEEEIIEMEISTTSMRGLLLFHGQAPNEEPGDFLSVGIDSEGKLEMRWELGSGEAKLSSNVSVADGKKHKVVLRRQGSYGSIEIDDGLSDFTYSPGPLQTLEARGNIFLGGVPNPRMTHFYYDDGFVGCIHSLKLQGSEPIDLNKNSLSAVNTGPCSKNGTMETEENGKHGHPKHKNGNKLNGKHHHTSNHHREHTSSSHGKESKVQNEVITGPDEYDEEYYIEGRHRVRGRRQRPHRQLRGHNYF